MCKLNYIYVIIFHLLEIFQNCVIISTIKNMSTIIIVSLWKYILIALFSRVFFFFFSFVSFFHLFGILSSTYTRELRSPEYCQLNSNSISIWLRLVPILASLKKILQVFRKISILQVSLLKNKLIFFFGNLLKTRILQKYDQ